MHWCMDETLAVLAMIPFLRFFFGKLHAWWHKNHNHKCHEKECYDTHVEHCHMPANIPHGKVGEGQCEQHPLVVHDEGPEPEGYGWDFISMDDVVGRFGPELVSDLRDTLLTKRGFELVRNDEISFYINDIRELKAVVRERAFLHGFEQCEHGWDEIE